MTFDHEASLRSLAAAQAPDPAVLDRLAARLRDAPTPRARRPALWIAALLALAPVVPADPGPVALTTDAVRVAPGVHVVPAGHGVAESDGSITTIAWDAGAITVDVDPTAGARVAVQTTDARVEVHGTVFTVDRGAFGTTVSVDRGAVGVSCVTGEARELTPADAPWLCLRDAGTGLGRVLALEAEGAPALDRLAALEAALAHPVGQPDTRAALASRRIDVWTELAAAALPAGCGAAAPWLARLSEVGDPDGLLTAAWCEHEPTRRETLLDALPADLDPERAAAARALRPTDR